MTAHATEIPIGLIDPGDNVRFKTGDIAELVASIKSLGIVVPLVLRPKGKRFEIIAGHRRFAAAKRARLKKVPATVREVRDQDVPGFMVAENVHRRKLTPLEIGTALQQLRDEQGLNQTQIAEQMGKSQSWVSQHLRLMALPREIREKVHRNDLKLSGALGYGSELAGIAGKGGGPGSGRPPAEVEGLVYVVLGLHGGLETPTVTVETAQEAALERRAELIRANTHRKVVICPYNVGEREEGAA